MKRIIKITLLQIIFGFLFFGNIKAYQCGETFSANSGTDISNMCQCTGTNNQAVFMGNNNSTGHYCCGFKQGTNCRVYEDPNEYGCGETNGSATVTDGLTCNCAGGQWESYEQWDIIWTNRGICCGWVQVGDAWDQCLSGNPSDTTAFCGETYPSSGDGAKDCICGGGGAAIPMDGGQTCCGWLRDGSCQKTDVGIGNSTVDGETLSNLNPISIGGGDSDLTTPGGIISKALGGFVFPIAGIILFIVLLLGGFQMLTGATNSKSLDEGKQRITSAIIGFLLLFAAYWIAQLLELIFGIRILS